MNFAQKVFSGDLAKNPQHELATGSTAFFGGIVAAAVAVLGVVGASTSSAMELIVRCENTAAADKTAPVSLRMAATSFPARRELPPDSKKSASSLKYSSSSRISFHIFRTTSVVVFDLALFETLGAFADTANASTSTLKPSDSGREMTHFPCSAL